MFLKDDESPGRTVGSTLTSIRTPASASSTSTSRNDHQLLGSSTKNRGAVSSGRGVVKESSKVVKKPRSLKPKVLKSSSKEPPPNSPLTTSVSVSSPSLKTPQERPRAHESAIKKPHSSLAVHKTTEAASGPGRGRGKVGGARPQEAEDKENTSPLPVAVPKAHDILAEQVGRDMLCGKGSSRLVIAYVYRLLQLWLMVMDWSRLTRVPLLQKDGRSMHLWILFLLWVRPILN